MSTGSFRRRSADVCFFLWCPSRFRASGSGESGRRLRRRRERDKKLRENLRTFSRRRSSDHSAGLRNGRGGDPCGRDPDVAVSAGVEAGGDVRRAGIVFETFQRPDHLIQPTFSRAKRVTMPAMKERQTVSDLFQCVAPNSVQRTGTLCLSRKAVMDSATWCGWLSSG